MVEHKERMRITQSAKKCANLDLKTKDLIGHL